MPGPPSQLVGTPQPEIASDAHATPADTVLAALGTRRRGLTEEEAARRLDRFGPNALRAARAASAWEILVGQVKSLVVALLFVAALVSLLFGDVLDTAAIGAVLVINTLLGFVTELRARREMEALLRLEAPMATVSREGRFREIEARDLVPGDTIEIGAGRSVPADARVLESNELRVNESALTGESLPESKGVDPVEEDTPLADRTSMLYMGTTVAAGGALAVVVATGMATELGRIGGLVAGIPEERTPLETRLDTLGRRLIWLVLGTAALVVAIGLLRGQPVGRMIETGIALAIAAVPEGLPAVATIALAAGVRRMARRRALIRRLPAVEALGSATVVCTDKTGTLTAGEMTLTRLVVAGHEIEVTGVGYAPVGEFREEGRPISPAEDERLELALRTAALSSRGRVEHVDETWIPRGDPTDLALVVGARKAGIERDGLLERWPQVGELPFTSERKFLASFHRNELGGVCVYAKGAPHQILDICNRILAPDGGEEPLDDAARARLIRRNEELAGSGLRVLALAEGAVEHVQEETTPSGLTFVALAGIIDPPAAGVADTIDQFRAAGIRTVMITGDQRLTAEAIARDLGVLKPGEESLDGRDLGHLGERELMERLGRIGVFSRVSPESKLTIVEAFQKRGEIVAMLGDGINDAAALKKASIGVAMGIRGTDAAKEAASVVLQDDRFQTIGAAVEEGRVIFDNIRKFVLYLFSCNLAEVLVLLLAGLLSLPVPLLPLQILWLNLVTDTFPALALAFEPAEPHIMRQPPRDPNAAILSRRFILVIAIYAAMITASTLGAFAWSLGGTPGSVAHSMTLGFMTLALAQVFHLANVRSTRPVVGLHRARTNPYAMGAVLLTFGLQFIAVYWTPLRTVLRLAPLAAHDWLVVAAFSLFPVVLGQAWKLARAVGREAS